MPPLLRLGVVSDVGRRRGGIRHRQFAKLACGANRPSAASGGRASAAGQPTVPQRLRPISSGHYPEMFQFAWRRSCGALGEAAPLAGRGAQVRLLPATMAGRVSCWRCRAVQAHRRCRRRRCCRRVAAAAAAAAWPPPLPLPPTTCVLSLRLAGDRTQNLELWQLAARRSRQHTFPAMQSRITSSSSSALTSKRSSLQQQQQQQQQQGRGSRQNGSSSLQQHTLHSSCLLGPCLPATPASRRSGGNSCCSISGRRALACL